MPIVSLADVKTYLGLTGTTDDQIISSLIPMAEARLERVTGRVVLHAGDRVRIGDPGVELAMIAVGESDASPPTD